MEEKLLEDVAEAALGAMCRGCEDIVSDGDGASNGSTNDSPPLPPLGEPVAPSWCSFGILSITSPEDEASLTFGGRFEVAGASGICSVMGAVAISIAFSTSIMMLGDDLQKEVLLFLSSLL